MTVRTFHISGAASKVMSVNQAEASQKVWCACTMSNYYHKKCQMAVKQVSTALW
ncbi:MAG: hypothetical protein R3E08_09185 [Thiotrichaceae bacterium]